ncbi:MAG: aminopeptidase P family protein [Solobacterium sp.]|nr:aminopeptidase P family protein [Solobacterium sp.]
MLKKERMERILAIAKQDQLLISDPCALFYLLGTWFYPGERFLGLIIAKGQKPVLVINALFHYEDDPQIETVYYSDGDDVTALLGRYVDSSQALGVDKILPARFLIPMIEQKTASAFELGSLAVDLTRAIKDEEEIALMRRSSKINDQAMEQFKTLIHEGVTEKEAASQIMDIYLSLGAEGFSFEPIVAFGKNAADPHHMPDDTVVKEGDAVLFDVGCRYHGYCSDMTRTFFYKKGPSPEAENVYNLVRKANEEAVKMLKPGIPFCEVDKKARDIITEGGYGEYFTHRLGHFIGVEDHEYGDVSLANTRLSQAGNIHSIEPGIYHSEILGCRIEDLVLITPDGYELLNHYPHDIEIIG